MEPVKEDLKSMQPLEKEKNRLTDKFLAELLHKLSNPLTASQGHAQLLLLKLTDPDHRDHVECIIREGGRITAIIRILTDYIKERELHKEKIDINDLITDTVKAKIKDLSARNIKIFYKLDPSIPLTQADPVEIQNVLISLIENAEQAVSEFQDGGEIRIETKANGKAIEIIMTDDGSGIEEKNISKIFNPLFTTRKNRMGMGLSIAEKIVESHDGEIKILTGRSKGTSFVITLPIIDG